ncbi:hypothetical protein GCM10023189_57950 [Nibrella saemangeumensis]|uniref:Uncharacterized protein n=1 Tax=Nibrella saemangeumensis TaxID=1084526 RepID=A0ABP8NR45_9BACT
MEKKKRIVFYDNLNGPHEAQVRENAALTPEQCWAAFQRMKRLHEFLFKRPEKRAERILIEKPSWK